MRAPLVIAVSLLSIVIVGCNESAQQQAKALSSASSEPKGEMPLTAAQRYCPAEPGIAPSGELAAQRIEAANTAQVGLYEGPVWLDGALYFSSFTFTEGFPSQVLKWQGGELTVALDNAGSNGLAVDSQGHLIAATHKYKAVSRYDLQSGERETLAGEYAGNVFNSPNDLTLTATDTLYFTDPDYQRSAAPGGQEATRVYRVEGDQVTVVDDTIANPNGISLAPDESVLYVAGGGEEGFLRAYPMNNGIPGEGRDIASLTIPDGMAVDCLGNIYATEHAARRVRIFTPAGEEIAHIPLDANVTNAAFGGPERKTLYITGAGSLWTVELDVAGLPY